MKNDKLKKQMFIVHFSIQLSAFSIARSRP